MTDRADELPALTEDLLGQAVLVVAHPDDEVLWFSSILRSIGEVIVCFLEVPSQPECSQGRQRVAREYPLPHVAFLGLTESGVFNGADWRHGPVAASYGLEVANDRNEAGYSAERYRANFTRLRTTLMDRLAGRRHVFTHNPWGEYGHEEHVQVYRAVRDAASANGATVWVGNYCSNKSHPLMSRYVAGFDRRYARRSTDPDLLDQMRRFYAERNCWTWFSAYRGFADECFVADLGEPVANAEGQLFPLNYIRVDLPWARPAPSGLASRLRRWTEAVRAG